MRRVNTPRRCLIACRELAKAYRNHSSLQSQYPEKVLSLERKVGGYRLSMSKIFGARGRFAFKKISARACRDVLLD